MLQTGGIYVIANVYAYDGQVSKAKLLFTFLYIFYTFYFPNSSKITKIINSDLLKYALWQ